jgi:hypothetical protein
MIEALHRMIQCLLARFLRRMVIASPGG